MKRNKINSFPLILDVADYLLVEWLIRNGHYSKFIANLPKDSDVFGPRDIIRHYLREILRSKSLTLHNAISAAFPFVLTPQGSAYWSSVEREWIDFLERFDVEL